MEPVDLTATTSGQRADRHRQGRHSTLLGLLINALLVVVKIGAGILGHSYALIADGVESTTDIVSSLIVWRGLVVSARAADSRYHFGYAKAEAVAAAVVAMMLLAAAAGVLFFPAFLFPLFFGWFAWRRAGALKFLAGFALVGGLTAAMVIHYTGSIGDRGPVELFMSCTLEHQEGIGAREYGASKFSFWGTHPALASFWQTPIIGSGSTMKPTFLLFVGLAMEMIASMVILVQLLVPLLKAANVDLVHFGIVMVANLCIGALTPRFHGAPTNRSQRVTTETDAPELLRRCREDSADVALLVPT